jgi:hypothetical protein
MIKGKTNLMKSSMFETSSLFLIVTANGNLEFYISIYKQNKTLDLIDFECIKGSKNNSPTETSGWQAQSIPS